jgi:magnesium-protoporphyrin O-methyltransferase
VSRTVIGAQNLLFRLLGSEFRAFAHPPEAMLEVLEDQGLRTITTVPAFIWQVAAAQRS